MHHKLTFNLYVTGAIGVFFLHSSHLMKPPNSVYNLKVTLHFDLEIHNKNAYVCYIDTIY